MLLIQKGQTVTNPPTPPYTEATEASASLLDEAVAVAATALHTHATEPYGDVALSPARAAIIAVNALVKAGLLLPEGAETRTEAKSSTKDLPLQPGDRVAFTSPSLFPGRESERLTGEVVRVADDGYVTVSVPQTGYEPMEVTAPADEFVRVRTKSDVIGAAFRAGRAQAAADIRAHADDEAQRPNRKSSSHLIEEWLREAALIAEGGGEADQSKDHQ